MNDLATAEEGLRDALQHRNDAALASRAATVHAEGLAARLAAGDTDITADELARARQAAEHAVLVLKGAEQGIPELQAEVQRLEAEEECDRIVGTLRALGTDLADSLQGIADALLPFVHAVQRFDQFAVAEHRDPNRLEISPRFRSARQNGGTGRPAIDGVRIGECRGMAQLASVIWEAAKAVGAGSNTVDDLKLLAAGAPELPTVER